MANPNDTNTNHAEQLFDRAVEFDNGEFIYATAWDVPESDAYPDGIHYRFQFGSPTGTILRYDNAHDGRHERHNPDGTVEPITFSGVIQLYERFLGEVDDWRADPKSKS